MLLPAPYASTAVTRRFKGKQSTSSLVLALAHLLFIGLVSGAALVGPGASLAQTAPSTASSAAGLVVTPASRSNPVMPGTASADRAKTGQVKSGWLSLTAPQKVALHPLMGTWDTLTEGNKRKWLEISKNYPALAPEDQAKMHSRMAEWVGLSQRARAEARLNYATTSELSRQLSPTEKKAKWEAYQALSPEEKRKLASEASKKPTGAATAVKPVEAQKLATVPGTAGGSGH